MSLEAIVLTRNEERHLPDCLRTLLWVDRVTVLDSRSTDHTVEIAHRMGARVLVRPFDDFAAQRNYALTQAEGDWVFFVDADERCTPELAAEIGFVLDRPEAGWWVPRDNYLFGRLTRYAGWSPDYQLRLLRRGRAQYDPACPVHETVLLDGTEGWLDARLVHYNYDSVAQFVRKQIHYSRLEAQALAGQGAPRRARQLLGRPVREFQRRFLQLEGWRMGGHGLLLSLLTAVFSGLAYAWYLLSPPLDPTSTDRYNPGHSRPTGGV